MEKAPRLMARGLRVCPAFLQLLLLGILVMLGPPSLVSARTGLETVDVEALKVSPFEAFHTVSHAKLADASVPKFGAAKFIELPVEQLVADLADWLAVNHSVSAVERVPAEDRKDSSNAVVKVVISETLASNASAMAVPDPVTGLDELVTAFPPESRPSLSLSSLSSHPSPSPILHLPASLHLSSDRIAALEPSLLPYSISQHGRSWTSFTVLAAWLLRQKSKGGDSPFAPLIRSLPSYVPLPVLYSRELMKEVDYLPLVLQVKTMRSALEEEFNRTSAKSRAKASKSQFLWAMTVVMSRAFSLSALPDIPYGLPPASLADPFFSGSKMAEAVMKAGNWPSSKEEEGDDDEEGDREGGSGAGEGEGASSKLVDSMVADFGFDEWQHREGRISRFSEPIMLLPLADLADHDWNATLAVQGEDGEPCPPSASRSPRSICHVSFSDPPSPSPSDDDKAKKKSDIELHDETAVVSFLSSAPLAPGTPLSLSYGSLTTDELFTNYGFIPKHNPFDTFPIFDTPVDVISYFARFHATGGMLLPEAMEWAVRTVDRAEQAVLETQMAMEALAPEQMHMQHFSLVDGNAYYVWANARADPRLLAALAALWFKWTQFTDVDFAELSIAAIHFGTSGSLMDCQQVQSQVASGAVQAAVAAAASLIRKRVVERLQEFKATIEEDEELLSMLSMCEKAGAGLVEASMLSESLVLRGFCKPVVMRTLEEKMLIARFRLAKKRLLQDVANGLMWPCNDRGEM